jgi:hypothetical protein
MASADCFILVDIAWIVGRIQDAGASWDLQGIAVSEQLAIEMCRDETYFIGPVPVGCPLEHKTVTWEGCYYPVPVKGQE